MSMQIKDGRYISRLYHIETRKPAGNLMAFLYRDQAPNDKWQVHIRLRIYKDDVIIGWDSKDENKTLILTMDDTDLDTVLQKARKVVTVSASFFTPEALHEIVMDTDNADLAMKKIGEQPWMHMNMVGNSPGGAA